MGDAAHQGSRPGGGSGGIGCSAGAAPQARCVVARSTSLAGTTTRTSPTGGCETAAAPRMRSASSPCAASPPRPCRRACSCATPPTGHAGKAGDIGRGGILLPVLAGDHAHEHRSRRGLALEVNHERAAACWAGKAVEPRRRQDAAGAPTPAPRAGCLQTAARASSKRTMRRCCGDATDCLSGPAASGRAPGMAPPGARIPRDHAPRAAP